LAFGYESGRETISWGISPTCDIWLFDPLKLICMFEDCDMLLDCDS
jgi:hypothetical protein